MISTAKFLSLTDCLCILYAGQHYLGKKGPTGLVFTHQIVSPFVDVTVTVLTKTVLPVQHAEQTTIPGLTVRQRRFELGEMVFLSVEENAAEFNQILDGLHIHALTSSSSYVNEVC